MFMDGNVQLKDFSDDVLRALHRQCAAALENSNSNKLKVVFHELGTGRFTRPHASVKYGVKPVHFIKKAAVNHRKKYRSIMLDAMKK